MRKKKLKLQVRWISPRNGCLREESFKSLRAARERVDELLRGRIFFRNLEN